jgi:hypothetical protein
MLGGPSDTFRPASAARVGEDRQYPTVTVRGVPVERIADLADGGTVMSMDVDASRVTFVAHAGRHLARCVSSSLALPVLLAGAPILFILAPLVWAVFGIGAAWNTVLVLAGILLMVGVVLAGFMAHDQLREPRWIECQRASRSGWR